MGHEDDGQEDAGDDVADNHLEERDVAAVGHRRHADDGQCAGLCGDDGQADAPPRNVLAAEEVVAGVVLVLPKPQPEPNDAEHIDQDDSPITRTEVAVHANKGLQLLGKAGGDGQKILPASLAGPQLDAAAIPGRDVSPKRPRLGRTEHLGDASLPPATGSKRRQ